MPSILDRVRDWLAGGRRRDPAEFLDDLFARFPFAEQTQEWLRGAIRLEIGNGASEKSIP